MSEFDEALSRARAEQSTDDVWAAFEDRYGSLRTSGGRRVLAWHPTGALHELAQAVAKTAPLSTIAWVADGSTVGPLLRTETDLSFAATMRQSRAAARSQEPRRARDEGLAAHMAELAELHQLWDADFTAVTAEGFATDVDHYMLLYVLSDGRVAYHRPDLTSSETTSVMGHAATFLTRRG